MCKRHRKFVVSIKREGGDEVEKRWKGNIPLFPPLKRCYLGREKEKARERPTLFVPGSGRELSAKHILLCAFSHNSKDADDDDGVCGKGSEVAAHKAEARAAPSTCDLLSQSLWLQTD